MGAIIRLIGLVLIGFAGWNLFMIFQDQILSEALQSQTTGFLDIFDPLIQSVTPQVTDTDIASALLYGVVAFVGLIMLIK